MWYYASRDFFIIVIKFIFSAQSRLKNTWLNDIGISQTFAVIFCNFHHTTRIWIMRRHSILCHGQAPRKNKLNNGVLLASSVWDMHRRLSTSFIASLAREVSNRGSGYTRPPRVLRTEHSRPVVPVSHRNPFPPGYDSLLYAPRGPPSWVLCALKCPSKRARDRYGDVRPRSPAA